MPTVNQLATNVFYTTLDAFKNTIDDKRNTFTEVQKEELTNIIMPAYHTKNMIKLTKILKTFGTVYEMHGGNPIVLAEGIDAIKKHKVHK